MSESFHPKPFLHLRHASAPYARWQMPHTNRRGPQKKPSKPIATDQRVYDLFRRHIETEGYPPNNSEAARMLGLSATIVRKSILRLAAWGFLSYTPRRWSSVRITPRYCDQCGNEIVLLNASVRVEGLKVSIRSKCNDCRRNQRNEATQMWREQNPGYNARQARKSRQKKRLTV